jgi:hypothetical protein
MLSMVDTAQLSFPKDRMNLAASPRVLSAGIWCITSSTLFCPLYFHYAFPKFCSIDVSCSTHLNASQPLLQEIEFCAKIEYSI